MRHMKKKTQNTGNKFWDVVKPHDMRVSYVTWMVPLLGIERVSTIVGHKSIDVTEIYNRTGPKFQKVLDEIWGG
jgi:site-specific recombinase XerC